MVNTYDGRASAAGVDELADGVGVVGEVDGQVLVSGLVGVVVDERLEVVGDRLRLVIGQAGRRIVVAGIRLVPLDEAEGRGDGRDGKEAGEEGEGTHRVRMELPVDCAVVGWISWYVTEKRLGQQAAGSFKVS